jgi:hypothetical protein
VLDGKGYERTSLSLEQANGTGARQVLFGLDGAYNVSAAGLGNTAFTFDFQDAPSPLVSWWGNPALVSNPGASRVVSLGDLAFVTNEPASQLAKSDRPYLLALSSWKPNPLPGGARIAIGRQCEQLWVLLQSYVHPMRNYVVNGEVVVHYATGEPDVHPLIPPFNLDVFFQHFSLEGSPVARGQTAGGGFIHWGLMLPHADALGWACDGSREVTDVEVRGTCGEGVIGLAGMTVVTPK